MSALDAFCRNCKIGAEDEHSQNSVNQSCSILVDKEGSEFVGLIFIFFLLPGSAPASSACMGPAE